MYTIMFEQYFSDFSDTMNVLFPKFNGKAAFSSMTIITRTGLLF